MTFSERGRIPGGEAHLLYPRVPDTRWTLNMAQVTIVKGLVDPLWTERAMIMTTAHFSPMEGASGMALHSDPEQALL